MSWGGVLFLMHVHNFCLQWASDHLPGPGPSHQFAGDSADPDPGARKGCPWQLQP